MTATAEEDVRIAAGWTPAAMVRLLDGDQAELRLRVRRLLAEPRFGTDDGAAERAGHRRRVQEQCHELAGLGLGRLHLPRADGGNDDLAAYLAVVETLGFGDLSLLVAFGVQFGLFAGSILHLGGEELRRRHLPAAGSLGLAGCFAMTETDHGSNVRGLETRARYDPAAEEFDLHTPHAGAAKDYIGNAHEARMAVVFSQLESGGEERGVHPLLVALRDGDGRLLPGVRVDDCGLKAGLHGVGTARIAFDHVRVPRDSLLDRFGQVAGDGTYSSALDSPSARLLATLGALIGGRVGAAAAAVSATKSALTIAVRYGAGRRQFGPDGEPETALLDYVVHQRRLLPALATTYALHFAVRRAAAESVTALRGEGSEESRRQAETLTAGIKVLATGHAVATVQACREACGGRGYLAGNRLGPLRADIDAFTTFEGDNIVLLQEVARNLLADFRAEFEDSSFLDVLRHLARPLAARVAMIRGVATGSGSDGRWRDRDVQLSALRWREQHLLAALARRMQRAIEAGAAPAAAFVDCQDHALDTARAYADRIVAETFASALDTCPDASLRPVLATLADLSALRSIDAGRAWFLERRYIGTGAGRALRPTIKDLCRQLRADAVQLVDAFDIPAALLGAPIGGSAER